jgi:hypothetical protein
MSDSGSEVGVVASRQALSTAPILADLGPPICGDAAEQAG